jgi:protein O-mannosyl-transferase
MTNSTDSGVEIRSEYVGYCRRFDGRLHAGAMLLLLAAILVTYANSFEGKFLGDGGALILEDARVQSVSRDNLDLIVRQQYWYPTADSGVYRPLVTLSFLFNYAIAGNADRPAGYHWINLALHAANAMLVWLLALMVWKRPLPAFFTAAIFAVHPVNVESVTNIAGRADLMAGMGALIGLVLYTRLPDVSWSRRFPSLLGIFFAALFGLFSKESAVVLPAAMLLYDLVFRIQHPFYWRRSLSGYLAVAPALLTTWWFRHWVFSKLPTYDQPFVDNPLVGADFLTARLTAAKVIIKYIGLLLWPRSLSWDYSYNQVPLTTWGACVGRHNRPAGAGRMAVSQARTGLFFRRFLFSGASAYFQPVANHRQHHG